eukprot:618841_1
MAKLQREKDDLYNKLGAYLDHNEIAKLKDKLCLLSDTKAMELIQLKMLLQNVYNCRMSIKQCHKNIFNAFKLVGDNDNESAIRRALYSQSKMNRVVRFNFNVLAHLLGALTVITLVPKKGLVLEHDGTERIKRNLMGVLLEWEITKNIDSKFKRMTKGGKTVSISDHIRNTKIKTLGNLVIGYKECDGKDSRSLFNFFRKLFDETDRFQNILNRPENLENYNLFTKNHLLEFLNYLEVCYPSVHELVLDISMNEKITHLMETAKNNKENLKQLLIQNIMNKLMTKTDHIRVNAEKQRIENQRQKSKEIKQKEKKQRKTKTARHMSSKENKKQKKKQADMNAMRKGAERMRNNNTNNKNTNNKKKSKKYKKKDCVEESGIGEFVNMLQKIGYCDKRARAKPSNAMSLSPMSQASDEAIDRPDDDEDHALLKEMEQLDAFSDDEDEKSE